LRISGEVITTPYSFVATSNALIWNKLKPVFVDIDPISLNMDPGKIEAAITPQTSAILPVHCYGTPCNIRDIRKIADAHGLKVIYDAAHAFGVQDRRKSILLHGDLSVLSFHATKVFNTFEGGAIVCRDAKTKKRIDSLKNFGFVNEVTVTAPGINGKMSEINAAFGMLQLKHIDDAIEYRRRIALRYKEELNGLPGLSCLQQSRNVTENHAYFPVFIKPNFPLTRDQLYHRFREQDILVRRYFYPLISEFSIYKGLPSAARANLPIATRLSREVLCLPIHPALGDEDVSLVIDTIKTAGKTR
jgi:dTDP-4-amino-4,6-dideoxygalactose transaminase